MIFIDYLTINNKYANIVSNLKNMKKVIFAVMLGVATLGVFSSCKKDDLASLERWEQEQKEKEGEGKIEVCEDDTSSTQVAPQPQPNISLKLVSKYASVGSQPHPWELVTFYYAVDLVSKDEISLPVYGNQRRISIDIDISGDIELERNERYFTVFYENDQLEEMDGFYRIKAGKTYRLIYSAHLSKLSQTMYGCKVDAFAYQTFGGETHLMNFPEDMGLRVFVEAF